jgi:hypothetical protein
VSAAELRLFLTVCVATVLTYAIGTFVLTILTHTAHTLGA